MKRRAFTLIEVLVVIAVIAILAAILFPVFAEAREKARQATCSTHMRQIGIALVMYRLMMGVSTPVALSCSSRKSSSASVVCSTLSSASTHPSNKYRRSGVQAFRRSGRLVGFGPERLNA